MVSDIRKSAQPGPLPKIEDMITYYVDFGRPERSYISFFIRDQARNRTMRLLYPHLKFILARHSLQLGEWIIHGATKDTSSKDMRHLTISVNNRVIYTVQKTI